MKSILRKAISKGKLTILAVVAALTLVAASTALAGTGVGATFNLGQTNTVNAISKLVGSTFGSQLVIDNNGDGPALNLQVEPGKPPLVTRFDAGKATNLDADKVDGKSAEELSRVAQMQTGATTELPPTGAAVTYGNQLSITAPAAGFVRLNGNVTVLNSGSSCTSGCQFNGTIRHINSGSSTLPSEGEVLNSRGNVGLDAVFPVNAGVNTFDIRLNRFGGNGTLFGWWATLTAEYTPYGSTGGSALGGAAATAATAANVQINKEDPGHRSER